MAINLFELATLNCPFYHWIVNTYKYLEIESVIVAIVTKAVIGIYHSK